MSLDNFGGDVCIYILIQKAGGKGCLYDRDEGGFFLFIYYLHTVWHWEDIVIQEEG